MPEEPPAAAPTPPWHSGEIALQASLGVAETMARLGQRVIRPAMNEQHRRFFEQLPFAVLGGVDAAGLVWASPCAGLPGFLQATSPTHLTVARPGDAQDPLDGALGVGEAAALLGIEPATRRRNRLNGTIASADAQGFAIAVAESFGNCPQYIQRRTPAFTRAPQQPSPWPAQELAGFDPHARAMVEQADSFFVASFAHTPWGRRADVSHRGGRPGFVRLADDGTLSVPDFAGNRFFNTLGNILQTGRAGLVFIDWSNGDLLHISGDARVVLDAPEMAGFAGAERMWQVAPRRMVRRRAGLALRWHDEEGGPSASLAATGTWAEAQALDATRPLAPPPAPAPGPVG